MTYSVLACARSHPTAVEPYRGLFNHRSLSALARYGDVAVDAMVPVPKVPPVGLYSRYSQVPAVDSWGEYESRHPRFLYPLPKRFFKYTVAAKTFSRTVSRCARQEFTIPDVVHAGHIYFDGYGMLEYCREYEVPLFVMGRGYTLNNYHELPRAARRKVDVTLSYCSGVLCVSEELARIAEDLTKPRKVTVLPNGAAPGKFPTEHSESIRRELEIPPEQTVVLFVGSFTERKGLRELMAVLSSVELPETTFVFVGHHGDLRWELEETLRKSGTDYRMFWQLSPLALRRLYAVADLLVLPSHAEGRPNVIYEAMASETAVLGTDIGGIREQVVDGATGVLVPPREPSLIEKHLVSLVADRERLAKMGQRGRDRLVSEGWSWEAHAERLASLHRAAIEGEKRAGDQLGGQA